ncbi:hypothetical protein [Actinoplanes sp. NPDC026619]|uniref:hypothetical protein n=1 Tax=Actinoplanes sp. NPDC026619 TaxID=3155798 RepID=UPI0033E672D7
MTECHSSYPGDFGGFFAERNPDVPEMSIEWSNAMHANASVSNVFSIMDKAYSYLLGGPLSRLERHSARLTAAEIVRGVVVRVVGHRMAMSLAPLATAILSGDDSIVVNALEDPTARAMRAPRAGVRTDFARVWLGDDARLLVVIGLLMQPVALATVDQLPSGIRAGTLRAGVWVTHAANALVRHRGLQREQAEATADARWGDSPRSHFVIRDDSDRGGWRQRYLLDALAPGPKMDAQSFLLHNTEAAAEHVVAFLTDVMHEFAPYPQATAADRCRAIIARLHLVNALAYMGNQQNAESEYQGRYVESDVNSGVSARIPLVSVQPHDSGFEIVPHPSSDYAKVTRGRRGRCPGPDALEPVGAEIQVSGDLRTAMTSILAGRSAGATRLLDRPYSEPDVITALGAGVSSCLMRRGFATFDRKDVAGNLGPADRATSTGSYVLSGR